MPEIIPLIRSLPEYEQHPNGCGLASLLMLLDLPQNPAIKQFLSKVWKKISPLFNHTSFTLPELQWAIALQYLLLKSLGNAKKEALYQFFNSRMEYSYEDAKIINNFTQEQNRKIVLDQGKELEAFLYLHYTELDDYVTPPLLMRNLHTMKTDVELKILAEIFNYSFVFCSGEDSTGAIYFPKSKSVHRLTEQFKEQWRLLEQYANDPSYMVLYGQYHHWLAVRGVYRFDHLPKKGKLQKPPSIPSEEPSLDDESISDKQSPEERPKKSSLEQIQDIFADEDAEPPWNVQRMIVDLNDPATGHQIRLNFAHLNDGDRFYVFKKHPDSDYTIFSSFLIGISKDIKIEIKYWKKFLTQKYDKKGKDRTLDVFQEEGMIIPKYNVNRKFSPKSDPTLSKEQELEQRISFFENRDSDLRTTPKATPKIDPETVQPVRKVRKQDPKKKSTEPPKFWEMLDDD